MSTRDRSRGFTLVELMAVIALVSVTLAVAALTMRKREGAGTEAEATAGRFEAARSQAARTGVPVVVRDANGVGGVVFLPDGRAVGSGVDPLTARVEPLASVVAEGGR